MPRASMTFVVTTLATFGIGAAAATGVMAEEYRGTSEQQMACTPDVFRLCGGAIPDVDRIVLCLRSNTPYLSQQCRAVFEAHDGVARPPRTARREGWQRQDGWQGQDGWQSDHEWR